ncbi:hypothetical protein L2E82_12630 [Cichorium intybus]|uniref:Uncharacterized protein n=1 Tax=Cichorium intybus TaxID=13427 RepID=A0ACB9GGD6_CICIN|nr:hypothetical protein L2E82_12630 [Cichorium intybus]
MEMVETGHLGGTFTRRFSWSFLSSSWKPIDLHVLTNNEIVDRDGKSALLSLLKTFDSILAVYEGFCNLKQVDLKLKICRGTSFQVGCQLPKYFEPVLETMIS